MISHPTLSKRVLQRSTRPYAFCLLQALLLGTHCLSFFASPLCSSHPCLLANLTLACLRAFASAVSFFLLGLLFLRYPHFSHSSFLQVSALISEDFSDHPSTVQVPSLPSAIPYLKEPLFSLPPGRNRLP